MALQKQTKQLVFSQGIDTKTTPELLPIGKLHALENARINQLGKVSKKYGSTAFPTQKLVVAQEPGASTISSPKAGFTHINGLYSVLSHQTALDNALGTISPDSIYAWAPTPSKWAFIARSGACSAETHRIGFQQDTSVNYQLIKDACGLDGVQVNGYFFQVQYLVSEVNSFLNVIDLASNEVVLTQSLGALVQARVLKFGNRAIVLGQDLSTDTLKGYSFDSTALALVPGASVLTFSITDMGPDNIFDALVSSANGRLYIAYQNNAAGITTKSYTTIPTSGAAAVTNSVTTASAGIKNCISIFGAENTFGRVWVAWVSNGVGTKVHAYSASLTFVITHFISTIEATALTGAMAPDLSSNYVLLVGEFADSAAYTGINIAFFGLKAATFVDLLTVCYPNTGRNFFFSLASKIVVYNGVNYLLLVNSDSLEPTYFLCYLPIETTGATSYFYPIAKVVFGQAGFPVSEGNSLTCYLPQLSVGQTSDSFFCAAMRISGEMRASTQVYSPIFLKFDFADQILYQFKELGGLTYFNGGFPCVFDGRSFFEAAFLHSPRIPANPFLGAAGLLTSSSDYQVCVVFEYIDAAGNRHLSAPSIPLTVTLGVGDTSFTFYAATPSLSLHNSVNCLIYRTEANGTIFYLEEVNTFTGVCNGKPINVSCTQSDASLITHELLYTTSNVIENQCPTATKAVSVWKERIFCLSDDGVVFSKKLSPGFPAAWNPVLNLNSTINKSNVMAISPLRDKFLCFYQDDVLYTAGDGPDDLGNGAFAPLETASAGVGAVSPIAVIETQDSVMFQSRDGIRSITQALAISYIGAELQHYINENTTIYSANYNDSLHEIRISDGTRTYIYDTFSQQWSISTAWGDKKAFFWTGIGSTNKKYIRVRNSSPKLLYEDTSTFQDDSIDTNLKIRTGWITMDQFLGFERLYRIIILGRYQSDHTLIVRLFYDNVPQVVETFQIANTSSTAANYTDANIYENDSFAGNAYPLEMTVKPANQKCTSIRLEIEDSELLVSPGQGLEIVGINFVIGVKNVAHKIRAAQNAAGSGRPSFIP